MWWRPIRFQLLEVLGEGSQGRVFKALRRDPRSGLEQVVAVKILHSRTAVDLWRKEFESLARVRSALCVQVLSFERIGQRPALVLEYVDGVNLAQLAIMCRLEEGSIFELLAQIELALKDLHRQGVFHGDLSPQNILVDKEGKIRLLDFGLANSGGRLTVPFAAPERLSGASACASTDFFSLKRIEEFLTGQPPHETFPAPRMPCQAALAQSVRAAIVRRKLTSDSRTQDHQTRSRPKSPPLLGAVLILLATSSTSQSMLPRPLAVVSVHTVKWHYLWLNGKPMGYAPLVMPVRADSDYRLEWVSQGKWGKSTLRLRPFERRTLEDSDFSH